MSRGPDDPGVTLAPVRCITLELKDLADTDDFEQNGEIGTLYGFEYTKDGYYKRKEVGDNKRFPKLEQLRNVEANNAGEYEYKIVRKADNRWHIEPQVEWDIKFEFISPFTFFDRQKNFRKALNSGPLHISLTPEDNSRGEIGIKPIRNKQYILHRKESVTKDSSTRLQFFPRTKLGDTFTMIFDIFVLKDENRDGVVGVSENLMKGILISWQNLDVERLKVTAVVLYDGEEIKVITTSDKINISLNRNNLTELNWINITHLSLIGFYYTEQVLTESMIKIIAGLDNIML